MSTLHGAGDSYLLQNTLSCVLEMCVGKVATVELRNEAHVTGRVVSVSWYFETPNVSLGSTYPTNIGIARGTLTLGGDTSGS